MKVIFDFDKTLTEKDTLFGFYKQVDGNNKLFTLKRIILLLFAFSFKLNIISNDMLKKIGVFMFLKGKTKREITMASIDYAKSIPLNNIYEKHYLSFLPQERMIVSASFEEYLQHIFPNEIIIGSKLSFDSNKVSGIEINLYGYKKKHKLAQMGINSIQLFYTDSYADKPLMEISKKVLLVERKSITILKNY